MNMRATSRKIGRTTRPKLGKIGSSTALSGRRSAKTPRSKDKLSVKHGVRRLKPHRRDNVPRRVRETRRASRAVRPPPQHSRPQRDLPVKRARDLQDNLVEVAVNRQARRRAMSKGAPATRSAVWDRALARIARASAGFRARGVPAVPEPPVAGGGANRRRIWAVSFA
jgi:hypothetical protein